MPYAVSLSSDVEFRLGRSDIALSQGHEAGALAEELGSSVLSSRAQTLVAQVLAGRGHRSEAQARARAARDVAAQTDLDSMVNVATWILGFSLLVEEPGEALVALELVQGLSRERGLAQPQTFPWQPDLVEAYVRLGRPDEARRALATLSEQAHRSGGSSAPAVTCRGRGLIDDDIDRHFGEALALHALTPTPFERARTELAYGFRLRRVGRRTEARGQLERALATFEDLGAEPWARQAREEIGASGARLRPRRGGPSHEELSPRELQVALVVASGLTNREAGARLFLSEKTIERHLGVVYRKLGLRSRTELAARMAREEPAEAPAE